VTFAIKVYKENPDFPSGGKFTQHLLNNVHVGDTVYCAGPIGKICYKGWGKFDVHKKPLKNKKMKVGLIAAGSGFTPMFAIA
jgi:ferredoxin-NADP reductase